MIIDVYDNLLEPHVAEMIDMEMKEVTWKYDYNSHKDGINKHWHRFCGHETIEEPYSFINYIWDTAKYKYNFEEKYETVIDDYCDGVKKYLILFKKNDFIKFHKYMKT